jgi:hypothetical protein
MAVKTTADALILATETRQLLSRAIEALEKAPRFGPVGLGEFIEPVTQLHDVLEMNVPELERIIATRLR